VVNQRSVHVAARINFSHHNGISLQQQQQQQR